MNITQEKAQRDIQNLERKHEKHGETVRRIGVLETRVQENSASLVQHAGAIKDTDTTTSQLVDQFAGIAKEVQHQGQKTGEQLAALTKLIEKQQSLTGNQGEHGNNQRNPNRNASEKPKETNNLQQHNRGLEKRNAVKPTEYD